MSTEQKITAAQLAAARTRFWHQAASSEAAVEVAEHEAADADDLQQEQERESASEEEGPSESGAEEGAAKENDVSGVEPETPAVIDGRMTDDRQALLTLEAARGFLEDMGLLLFRPQPALSVGPAATFVEATLGERRPEVTIADSELARGLLARLIAEGAALPLNLTGAPGTTAESPDYIASAAAFPYLFTLRGDKTWKQLPSSTGPNKVSPLAVNTYVLLAEGEPQTAVALTAALGKGLTEAAVLRALGELWQQMRVFPVLQTNGNATVWELASSRWTKQLKAGANAGQPTALSALISLYLRQMLLATEDEVATFLSPVAARSRVRDVLHGLLAAQEIEELVIDGKQHLHVEGELPDLRGFAPQWREAEDSAPSFEGAGRIRRFKDARPGRGLERSRPFAAREGRPERRSTNDRSSRPSSGDRSSRPSYGGRSDRASFGARSDRPSFGARGERPSYGGRSERPSFGDRSDRPSFGDRSDRGPRKPFRKDFGSKREGNNFARRQDSAAPTGNQGDRTTRRFDKPWEERAPRREWRPDDAGQGVGERSDRAPRADGERGGFKPRGDRGEQRPARFNGDRPAFQRKRFEAGGDDRPRPWQRPEGREGRPQGDRPFRKPFGKRESGDGFAARGSREDRQGRPERSGADREQRRSSFGASRPQGDFRRGAPQDGRPDRGTGERSSQDRPFRRFDAPRPGKKPFGAKPERRDGKPDRAGKRPFAAKSGGQGGSDRTGARSESPFAKFVGGAKPWGKRPPKPKVKPITDEERA